MADQEPDPATRRDPAWLQVATSLQGCLVRDSAGEVAGSIAGLVTRGSAVYAVIASGGFLGLGERRFVVPWSALQGNGGSLVLRDSRELERRRRAAPDEPT